MTIAQPARTQAPRNSPPGTMVRSEAAAYLGCSIYAVDRLCRRYGVERTRGPRGYNYVTRIGLAKIRAQLDRIRSGTLLTEREAAARAGVSYATLRTIMARGELTPTLRAPRARYFHPDAIDAMVARLDPEGYVSTAQVCAKLGLTRQRVSQLVHRGRLHPDINPRGQRRFAVVELDAYAVQDAVQGREGASNV